MNSVSSRVIRLPEVLNRTGLSRSQIYRMVSQKKFPSRVQLSVRTAGWIEREVEDWLAGLVAQRDATLTDKFRR